MSSCVSRLTEWHPLSGSRKIRPDAGQHSRPGASLQLIYRKETPAKPEPPKPVVQKLVQQTVVQVFQHHTHRMYQQAQAVQNLQMSTYLLLMPPAIRRRRQEWERMESRPTDAARQIVRLFSKESAQKQMRPFYNEIVRNVLHEEQDRYRSKPTQAISLIWNLFGRQQAFRTLTRFYMSAVEKLGTNYYPALHGSNALYLAAGVVMNSQVYRRYVQKLWSREQSPVPLRYAHHQQALAEDVLDLQVARRVLPPQEPVEEIVRTRQVPSPEQEAPRIPEVHLSEADFRALVQGVASSLGRHTHVESLRRGGI